MPAAESLRGGMKLAIVGEAPYGGDYISLRVAHRGPARRVPGIRVRKRHAYPFCAPAEVGGTHPVIFEAMAAGNCVLVNDHRPNAESVGDAALLRAVCEGSGPGLLLDSLLDRERGGAGMRCSMKNVAAVLVIAVMSSPQVACGARARSDGTVTGAACMRTRYLLIVYPGTTTSNERHTLEFQATANACGHRAPVRGAGVRLGSYRATTDAHGRASLTVRLQTGRYLIRLLVHGRVVARARVWAIPNVSS
jgi:hypothetical protein